MDVDWLKSVVEDDDMGLLDIKTRTSAPSADEHLIAKFNEINEFITFNGREPLDDMNNVPEFMLFQRLKSIRNNEEQCNALSNLDIHNLLPTSFDSKIEEAGPEYETEQKEINSFDDIFSDDDLGLLDDSAESIFNLKHVTKERADADFVSRRNRCKDFDKYEHLFIETQKQIKSGERILRDFNDKGESLVEGCFYIQGGMLLYLESIDISREEKTVNGKRSRKDGRTRCIFENGTESNMLYRSLAKVLYVDGKIVTESNDSLNDEFLKNMNGVIDDDVSTGFIYVLSSLSSSPEIQNIHNLHKIGYSTTPIEERIANAENEPTYLMAPVKFVSGYECFNMDANKLEGLLHKFFGDACLDIEITDNHGKVCKPREWFIAPLGVIEEVISMISDESIVNYKYDEVREKIMDR